MTSDAEFPAPESGQPYLVGLHDGPLDGQIISAISDGGLVATLELDDPATGGKLAYVPTYGASGVSGHTTWSYHYEPGTGLGATAVG
jgi:hypothetical protein